jgi:hypothetical protein
VARVPLKLTDTFDGSIPNPVPFMTTSSPLAAIPVPRGPLDVTDLIVGAGRKVKTPFNTTVFVHTFKVIFPVVPLAGVFNIIFQSSIDLMESEGMPLNNMVTAFARVPKFLPVMVTSDPGYPDLALKSVGSGAGYVTILKSGPFSQPINSVTKLMTNIMKALCFNNCFIIQKV